MDTLSALQVFVRVAESGTFSAAAREAGTSQSAVTRQVAQLEERYGVRLFHRTTRNLSLTEDGDVLLEHARFVLDATEGMEAALDQRHGAPVGHVRLGTSTALGLLLTPRLPQLFDLHPNLSVDLVVSDHFGDMIEERLDVAIRPGEVTDLSLVARRLGMYRRIVVASPSYLAQHGDPAHPHALTGHNCLVHDYGQPHASDWRFESSEGILVVPVSGRFASDNGEAVRRAVVGGLGIALLPYGLISDDVRSGVMRIVLPRYLAEPRPSYLVYPSRRHLPPRTRAVIDFVVGQIDGLNVEMAAFFAQQCALARAPTHAAG